MPYTELAVLCLYGCSQPCPGLQEAAQSSEPHCFAMKNTGTAWVATNGGWVLMMEGATSSSFSVGKTTSGWVGAIPEQWDASKQVSTILCTVSALCHSVKQGWKASGLFCSELQSGRDQTAFL